MNELHFMLETRDRWDELRTRIGAHCLHLLENYTSVPPLPKLHEAKETSLHGETERIGTMNLLFHHDFEKLQAAGFMKKDEQTKVDWNFENAYLRAKKLICQSARLRYTQHQFSLFGLQKKLTQLYSSDKGVIGKYWREDEYATLRSSFSSYTSVKSKKRLHSPSNTAWRHELARIPSGIIQLPRHNFSP